MASNQDRKPPGTPAGGEFSHRQHQSADDVDLYDYPESDEDVTDLEDDSPTDFRGHYDGPVPVEVEDPPVTEPVRQVFSPHGYTDLLTRARLGGYQGDPDVTYSEGLGGIAMPQISETDCEEMREHAASWREMQAAKERDSNAERYRQEQQATNERLWGKS